MEVLYVLVPLGVAVAFAGALAFWAAARDGQFDDLEARGAAIVSGEERTTK